MDREIDIPIQAWLSYRCKDTFAQTQRDELKAICKANNIRLVYDESDAQEGDDLIKFMEDLTSARCVFIFLAPDYFESSSLCCFLFFAGSPIDNTNKFCYYLFIFTIFVVENIQ